MKVWYDRKAKSRCFESGDRVLVLFPVVGNPLQAKYSGPYKVVVRTKGYSTVLLDPTQVESKKSNQIQWPVPSINAEPVDIFLGEE